MISADLEQKLNGLISGCLNQNNLELVDLIIRPEGGKLVLRVLADKPEGGIILRECALANRKLLALLEAENIIDCDYLLEVSSPGLDRCLKTEKDFLRCKNKEVVFFLSDMLLGKCQWQGTVEKVSQTSVFIINREQNLEIPLIKINKAQLVI